MSQFVEVKTAELVGPALELAIATALGIRAFAADGRCYLGNGDEASMVMLDPWSPSTDWAQGGTLWDEWATSMEHYDGWLVAVVGGDATGPTKLIALCRAIVSAKMGDVVQVPAELVGQ